MRSSMREGIYPIIAGEDSLPVYMTGIGYEKFQSHVVRPSGFPTYHLLYSAGGSGVLCLDSKQYVIAEKTGVLLFPGAPHEYYPETEPWETHWITFDGNAVQELVYALGFQKSRVFPIGNLQMLEAAFFRTLAEAKSDNINKGFLCSALLYGLLVSLKVLVSGETHSRQQKRAEQIRPVITHINRNFQQCLSLGELAGMIHVSPQYLCRLFKSCYGMRPFEYVAKRRIQEAKRLLLESRLPIREIALKTGHNDPSYFCAIFRKYEKITPDQFRNLHGG